MRTIINKLYQIIFLFFFQYSVLASPPEQFKQKIDELVNINFANAIFGLVLQDADDGKVLYEKSANTTFVPASATKLFAAAAALHQLTPKFCFQTTVKYDKAKLKNEVLAGPVAIEFKGDPSLTLANLKELVNSIKQAKITTIQGNLILDDSYFQGQTIGNGWSVDDTPWYYASPVSAIILNENQVHIAITSGKQLGDLASVKLIDPNSQYFTLSTMVKTVTQADSENICQLQVNINQANGIYLEGCWPISKESTNLKLAIQNSRKFAHDFLTTTLAEEKIQLKGNIVYSKTPANMATLAVHYSLPLAKLLPKMLAESNNLYAEALIKTLGAELFHEGSFQTGVLAIKNILQKPTGINFDAMKLVDGSGVSRYTLITPNQFTRLLYTMYHTPKLKKHYVQALALAGATGFLKSRLASFDTYANIQAKTGTMTGVSALSGYITTRANRHLIFTMLVNNTLLPASTIKKVEDELCQVIANYAQ